VLMRRGVVQPAVESMEIAAPAGKVWTLLTRVEGIPSWYDGWDSVEVPPSAVERFEGGLTFVLVREDGGRKARAHCRVTEVVPGRRVAWVESGGNGDPVLVRFDLVSDGDDRSTVRFTKAPFRAAGAEPVSGLAAR